eukprot:757517-Hanusia_phi.AAC.2
MVRDIDSTMKERWKTRRGERGRRGREEERREEGRNERGRRGMWERGGEGRRHSPRPPQLHPVGR